MEEQKRNIRNEILYYAAYTCPKKLMEQGVRQEILKKANVALAEQYGVSQYNI